MKKVIIYAYIDQNLGDDLFVQMLCQRYPQIEFELITESKAIAFTKTITNLSVTQVKRTIISKIWNRTLGKILQTFIGLVPEKSLLEQADAAVYIGGSLFMEEHPNWKIAAAQLQQRIQRMPNFYILGCNFGPYHSPQFLETYREIFSQARDVCFRDQQSFDSFSELTNIRLSTDIVFGLEMPKVQKQKQCVISLIELHGRDIADKRKDYVATVSQIIEALVKKGYSIQLVSFCEPQGDEVVINEVKVQLTLAANKVTQTYFYHDDLATALKLFEAAELVIATRFHAMILGFVSGAKVFPIIYSQKMEHVLRDINFTGPKLQISQLQPDTEIQILLQQLMTSEVMDITSQKKSADQQFFQLDQQLKED